MLPLPAFYHKEKVDIMVVFHVSNLILCLNIANVFHVSLDALLDGFVEYEMEQILLRESSEQFLAKELLQVVKR